MVRWATMSSLTGSVATRVAFGARPCRRSLPCRRSNADERHGSRGFRSACVRIPGLGSYRKFGGAAALASNTSSGVATNESVSGDWPIRAYTNLPDDKGLALVFAKRTQFSFFLLPS